MTHEEKIQYIMQNGQRYDQPVAGIIDPKNLQASGQPKLRHALWLSIISLDADAAIAEEFHSDLNARTEFTGFSTMCNNEEINGYLKSDVYVDLPRFPNSLRNAIFYVMMSQVGEKGLKLQTIPGAWTKYED